MASSYSHLFRLSHFPEQVPYSILFPEENISQPFLEKNLSAANVSNCIVFPLSSAFEVIMELCWHEFELY